MAGVSHNRCYTWNGTSVDIPVLDHSNQAACGGWGTCPNGQQCLISETAPYSGVLTFDTILSAWLNLFIAISKDGWTDTMYTYQDAYSYWVSTVYFHILIITCSLFAMTLCISIIRDSYEKVKGKWEIEVDNLVEHLRSVNLHEEVLLLYST